MKEILGRTLRTVDGRPIDVRDCRLANMRHRDGTRGTVQYDLQLADTATNATWDQIVTGLAYGAERTRRVWEVVQSKIPPMTVSDRPVLQPFFYVPELDMILQVFPHDHRLPGLARFISGPVQPVLPALLLEFGAGDWNLESWSADVVQYRVDMRAIIRLTIRAIDATVGKAESRDFYAKIYRDAEQAERAFATQHALHDRATAASEHLRVAKPVAYDANLRTVITADVSGTSLARILRRGDDDNVEAAMRAAGRALADFHRLDIDLPRRDIEEDIARLSEAEAAVSAARPDLERQARGIVAAVIAGTEGAPVTPIHGDLKPEHILIDGSRVALIDFDLAGLADPVIDVSHLVAFLGKSQERSRSAAEDAGLAARVFLDEYFSHVPPSWRHRLRLYHAMTSIHKAAGLSRRGGDRHDLASVIKEGEAFLAGQDGDEMAPAFKRRLTRSTTR